MITEKKSLSDKDASDIINDMNNVLIEDTMIGNMMRSYFVVKITNNWEPPKITRIVKDIITIIKLKFFVNKTSLINPDFEKINGLPLLTFIKNVKHLYNLNKSIYDLIEGAKFCLALDKDLIKSNINKEKLIFLNQLKSIYDFSIKKNDRESINSILSIFIRSLKTYGLSKIHIISFYLELRYQIAVFKTFKTIFNRYKPSFILAETDAFGSLSPIITAAKQSGIKTFIHTHGPIIHEIGVKPLIADEIFIWGQFHYDYLQNMGIDENKMHITGAPHFKEGLTGDKKLIKSKLKLINKFVVLFASNNENKRSFTDTIIKTVNCLPENYSGVIRPHPSENSLFYKKIVSSHSRLFSFSNNELNANDSLLVADIVVVCNSAFLYDAIRKNRIPILFKHNSVNYGEIEYLIRNKIIPYALNAKNLSDMIISITETDGEMEQWSKKINNFKNQYWYNFGQNSAKKIVRRLFK